MNNIQHIVTISGLNELCPFNPGSGLNILLAGINKPHLFFFIKNCRFSQSGRCYQFGIEVNYESNSARVFVHPINACGLSILLQNVSFNTNKELFDFLKTNSTSAAINKWSSKMMGSTALYY